MVGPSITDDDRKAFVRNLKIGFALLVGLSMGLVTLYSGADLSLVVGATVGATLVGAALAWFTIPDSVAGIAYEERNDERTRGPKPGTALRQQQREEREEHPRATDGNGQSPGSNRN
jgi:hypothetical protein